MVATIALFLALGGSAVWAANKIQSSDIAAKAIKTRNLATGAVTNKKVKGHSLRRSVFHAGQLPGVKVADVNIVASNLNIITTPPGSCEAGFAPPGLSFVPAKDPQHPGAPFPVETYVLEEEISGTVTDADGAGGGSCTPRVESWVNGKVVTSARLVADADLPMQANTNVASAMAPVGLTSPGEKQTVTLHVFPDSGCGAGSKIDRLRAVVVELG